MNGQAGSIYEPLRRDGRNYSCIRTGLKPRVFRSVDPGELQNSRGWIFDSSGNREPWRPEGIMEEEDELLFYGPAVRGCAFSPETLNLERFILILRIFSALKDDEDWEGFYASGWIFLEEENGEERILLLPLKIMNFIRRSSQEAVRQKFWYPYNCPDISGEKGMIFTSGILACLYLKGPFPYAPLEEKEDDRNEQLRRPPLLPPEILIPGLSPEVSALMKASLPPGKSHVSLKMWLDEAEGWKKEAPLRPLSREEKEEIEKKAAALAQKGKKGQSRRQILRKKGNLYAILAGVFFLILAFISVPVRKALEPPLTMDMSPRQVVEAYYTCFDSMNQELMEDCAEGPTAKGDMREVTNLFVTGRVRMGYEGKSGLVPVLKWLEEGRPALKSGINVYGIAHLKIKALGEDHFVAEYEKWIPGASATKDKTAGIPIRDILTLEKEKKGNWRIKAIQRNRMP